MLFHLRSLRPQDDATNDGGTPRPNLMTTNYIWSDVVQPTSPQGGRTAGPKTPVCDARTTRWNEVRIASRSVRGS